MPWPTVCALSLALVLSFSVPLSHRHTGAYMSVYVLTVAAIVISFLLYECVCPCVCVCVCVWESDVLCGFVSVVALTFDETEVTFV